MAADAFIIVLPIILIMAVCAYEVFYWEKMVKCRKKSTKGKVSDDEAEDEKGGKLFQWVLPPWRRKSSRAASEEGRPPSSGYGSLGLTRKAAPGPADDDSDASSVFTSDDESEDGFEAASSAELDEHELDEGHWITQAETDEMRQRFCRLARSLSVVDAHRASTFKLRNQELVSKQRTAKKSTTDLNIAAEDAEDVALFDCILVAGLYHDTTVDKLVPFNKDLFPPEVSGLIHLSW